MTDAYLATMGAMDREADAYSAFLARKLQFQECRGVEPGPLHPEMFEFQSDITRWALRRGRAAMFEDTGLGKTIQQLEWARNAGERCLILAPLAVAKQTEREAATWGIECRYVRKQSEVSGGGIFVTNYEMLEWFDAAQFPAVVLDESSILKHHDAKTRNALIAKFAETPMRLCCTATPAPNDIVEIANHAEFLGEMRRQEMLSAFFVHDDEGWRLKGHALKPFYKWLASWAMSIKKPSDLGYPDDGYNLPELKIIPEIVEVTYAPEGQLFATGLKGITDRSRVRRQTIQDRITRAASLVNGEAGHQWIIWCGLNDESRGMTAAIPGAVEVYGSLSLEEKEARIMAFLDGSTRVLVTKPSICGHGLNLQRCARMVFVGLSDSYEAYYQCIRRCYRFGQESEVHAHVVLTSLETQIFDNVLAKEREAEGMSKEIINHVADLERQELGSKPVGGDEYKMDDAAGEGWRLMLGDSSERIKELPDDSVDLSVFSPPFLSLYTYSPSPRDIGNCRSDAEFWEHFGYVIQELLRVTKPGRNVCVHCSNIATTAAHHGVIGLKDFRGEVIRKFSAAGFVFHGEICIDKDPQAQAIRTHSKALLFAQLRKDSSWLRPALADFIAVFRKPGENAVPVHPDITNDEWIEWARPIWYGIRESDTLNVAQARSENDERRMCALQLGTIERCIRLWSNKGDTVLSPFAGIGSEGYEAIRNERKFVGVELKPEYFKVAVKNLDSASRQRRTLFTDLPQGGNADAV